jgi:hypothetical protein
MVSGAKVVAPGNIYHLGCESEGASLKTAEIVHTAQKIARLTRFHGSLFNHILVQNIV